MSYDDTDVDINENKKNSPILVHNYLDINENKKNKNILVHNYIKFLFQYLGNKYCFLSGAFVIEDFDGILFHILYIESNSTYRNLLSSHTKYNQYSKGILKKGLSFIPGSHSLSKYLGIDEPEFLLQELEYPELKIGCQCPDGGRTEERTFRSCKFYKFIQNGRQFLYLKPEDYSSITFHHATSAINKYVFNNQNKSCRNDRREDCKEKSCRSKEISQQEPSLFENYKTVQIYNKEKNAYENINISELKEKYNRDGDEVYIPQRISNFILLHLFSGNDTPIIFNHCSDPNNDSVILLDKETTVPPPCVVEQTDGGKRKSKKTRKSKTNKK